MAGFVEEEDPVSMSRSLSSQFVDSTKMEDVGGAQSEQDPESHNSMEQPLLKRHRTLSSVPLAMVGAKVSYIESLDYEYAQDYYSNHLNKIICIKIYACATEIWCFLIPGSMKMICLSRTGEADQVPKFCSIYS